MGTRLSTFCDKLLEAGWLVALIVAPLFFNIYSSRVFEPDKITLVRSLALVMVGAWLLKQIETGLLRGAPPDLFRAVWQANPLVLPTFAVVIVYLVSTILSVAPNVSLWGSYQRLQGTYTTFSYITIFFCAASTLRTRAQLDRAISVIIATSFPIALFGILQHFKLDPLPWGGDTTERVAANMGNSIFVAAYLIMVVPLTLARWIETLGRLTRNQPRRLTFIGLGVVMLFVLLVGWAFNFAFGIGLAIGFIGLALIAGLMRRIVLRDALLVATLTLILAAQLLTIFFSQSRGPWLGLGAGLFAFGLLGALMIMHRLSQRWRVMTLSGIIGLAVLAMVFLVIFNLPASPLEALKRVPYVGRLGQILDPNSPTARVRELIWQGALKLVLPHAPLWSPVTGDDPFNLIRPLVGYGPEAMYVVYNPFYPPELGTLEARNASPDRSHNETFDSLVITGLFGFGAYILLFVSIFYFGLKSLGFITTTAERNVFVALWLVTGFVFAIFFGAWRGWHWIGVALPAGMIVGFLIFLVAEAVRRYRAGGVVPEAWRSLWLSALIAAFIAHFVEIHFGIAIVSTRTYFWFYAALLVVIGMNHVTEHATTPAAPEESPRPSATRRRSRRRPSEHANASAPASREVSPVPVVGWTMIAILVMATLAFEFITNRTGTPSPIEMIKESLFYKDNQVSYGIFVLFALTWGVTGILGLVERASKETWLYDVLLYLILSLTALLWFVLLQTRLITTPGDLTEAFIALLSEYYIALFLVVAVLALALWFDLVPRPTLAFRSGLGAGLVPILGIGLVWGVMVTNYDSIKADILYKAGTNLDASGLWNLSAQAYKRAFDLQPAQDFYALFLGRAYLESARASTDATQRQKFLAEAESTLLRAQRLNPLNADHTANLARMERVVATLMDKPADRAEHFQRSSKYYADTLRISPYTAHLWNEWALTLMQSGELPQALEKLNQSLRIDPTFVQTYVYLGDYYFLAQDPAHAAENYFKALERDPNALSDANGDLQANPAALFKLPEYAPRAIETYRVLATKYPSLYRILAQLYKQNGQLDLARQALEQAVQSNPNDWLASLDLVNFLSEVGDIDAAVNAMKHLMTLVPQNRPDYARFQDFYNQLLALQRDLQAAQKSPNDVNAQRTVAARWKARGQPQFAVPAYQAIARLVPNDYDAQKNLVLLNLQLNRLEEAQNALTAAVALAPESDKPLWQNVQVALNAHKAGKFAEAQQAAQAVLALAADTDKPVVQAYLTLLQEKSK